MHGYPCDSHDRDVRVPPLDSVSMSILTGAASDDRRIERARLLILAWLSSTVITGLLMPAVGLFREPRPLWIALGSVGIVCFATAQAGLFHAVVMRSARGVPRRWAVAFTAASALSIVLVGPVAAGTWQSWAWIGAAIVGSLPVVLRVAWSVVGALAVCVCGAIIAAVVNGDVAHMLAVVVFVGAGIALINMSALWLWNLIADAHAGREAVAALAVSEERLRFAREVHDILGHSLSVIALKAELLDRRSADSPERAKEPAEIRALASSALEEMRVAVAGYRHVPLAEEIDALRRVLEASGVDCTVRIDADPTSAPAAFGPIAREAVTNVLRHSRASWCEIAVRGDEDGIELMVRNDGVTDQPLGHDPSSGGIDGIRDRLRDIGGTVSVDASGDVFELRAYSGSRA